MKTCPNCKHEVREDTGICPYCGYPFTQGKRTIHIPILPIMVTFMFLLPFLFTLFIGDSAYSDYGYYQDQLEKGALLKEVDQKVAKYDWMTFNSYATFSNYFSNGQEMMKDVLSFEKHLEESMIQEGYLYRKEEMAQLYSNYLVETVTSYEIKNQGMIVEVVYKEDNLQNESLDITLIQEGIDFESLKVNEETSTLFETIYTHLTNQPFTKHLAFSNLLQSLEKDFIKYYGRIGHYGLNANQDELSVKLSMNRDRETYRCEYRYKVK